MSLRIGTALIFLSIVAAPLAFSETPRPAAAAPASRDATRDKLLDLLAKTGTRSDVNVEFSQNEKQPYNIVGKMRDGMKYADYLEIVITVTSNDTIGFRVYPHYKGGYVNIKKARDAPGLMHKLLNYSDDNFLFWGADSSDDIFCGYTVTLESGFPDDAIVIIVRSMRSADKYVGELRPFIDGSAAPK